MLMLLTTDDGVDDELTMEPDLATTHHMKFVDNRCHCCPYGYHIDIDFLRYLDSLGQSAYDGENVAHLQQLYLRQKKLEAAGSAGTGGTRIGDDVDVQRQLHRDESRYLNVDSSVFRSSSRSSATDKYRTEAAVNVSRAPGQDYDSSSSVSIHSGPSSPHPYSTGELVVSSGGRRGLSPSSSWRPGETYPPPTIQNGAHGSTMSMMQQQTMTAQSMVTGGGMSDEVETFLVDGVVDPGLPGIPADMTLISSVTLQTIREQMAASLRRMKELEDENQSLRLLEVLYTVLYLLYF